ncbi:MAG: porin family protein [Chitinophagaceae bacterium]
MKKTIALLSTVLLAFTAGTMAQSTATMGRTTFGIRAGVNFQNINGKDESGDNLDYKIKTGFHVGVNAEVPVAPDFYIQPGVLFTTKGAKYNDDVKLNISYLEVPVNFLYKPMLGSGKLLLGVGPYIAFGVGGKLKNDNGTDADVKFKNEISPGEALTALYLKRLDAGGNLLFGYEFSNKLSFQFNAQLGMVKINPKIENVDTDAKYRNTGFGVSAGYRF